MTITRKIQFILPFAVFCGMVLFLWRGLSLDPHLLPSALINKPVPQFRLATVTNPNRFFTAQDLHGHISLVNVWATWCISCRVEHPALMDIAQTNKIAIYGIDYKDQQSDAQQWLAQNGNPYKLVGFDGDGSTAINWGVYGTPETFIIDKNGIVRYKYVGPVSDEIWQEQLLPVVTKLENES